VKIEARSPERRLRLLSPRGFGGREGRKKLPQSRDEVTKNAGPDEVLDVQETLIYLAFLFDWWRSQQKCQKLRHAKVQILCGFPVAQIQESGHLSAQQRAAALWRQYCGTGWDIAGYPRWETGTGVSTKLRVGPDLPKS